MPRGLIVDADGVAILHTPMTARREWERRHGKPPGALDAALTEAVGAGWAGGRGEPEIHRRLTEILGITDSGLPEVLEVLAAHQALNTELAALLTRSRPAMRTAILTNAGPGRRAELVTRFGADTLVDLIVVSAEEGVAKPDPAIYRLTCQRLGLAPADCLFVDDTPANVEGARRAGLRAELYSTVPELGVLLNYAGPAGSSTVPELGLPLS